MFGLNQEREVAYTALADGLVLSFVWLLFASTNQWMSLYTPLAVPSSIYVVGLIHLLVWMTVSLFAGMYQKLFLISRIDEVFRVGATTLLGIVAFMILRLSTVDLTASDSVFAAISIVLPYGGLVGGGLLTNRLVIRTIQRSYAKRGKGLHRAVIVGTGSTAKMIGEQLNQYKTLGMQVLGYYSVNGEIPEVEKGDILGDVEEFREMAAEMNVKDVIIALEKEQQEKWLPVVSSVDDPKVTLKMLPDFHQMVGGYAKTHQIFGLPLVDIQPADMPTWEWFIKRSVDILASAVVLIALFPLIVVLAILVRLSSEGPAIYKQKRVGKHGREFTMYKFRSMVNNAEAETGPIWATDDDPRVTNVGSWLRKTRLDEIPQFFNVLFGDMSLVGPRPERPHFVKKYERSIPLYSRRLRVKPGITGWAQVKWKYDESFDDVKERTKYDLFYVENISLRLDVKILINTLFVILRAEGK